MSADAAEALWTVDDVARFLRASPSWVYKAAARGAIPCVRIGAMLRFDPEALRRFVAQPPPTADVIPIGRDGSG